MKERIQQYRIISNWQLADQVFEIELEGDSSWITHPGQFLNVTIDNAYLKRPISICDWNENGLTLIYKVVGFGTKQMSQKPPGTMLECLVGLGNGFTPEAFEEKRVLTGTPIVVIAQGQIQWTGLKQARLNINELLSCLRSGGYFNLEEVNYAILEPTGNLSVLPHDAARPLKLTDLKQDFIPAALPTNVIIDGQILHQNLQALGQSADKLLDQIQTQKACRIDEIALATLDDQGKLVLYLKNKAQPQSIHRF